MATRTSDRCIRRRPRAAGCFPDKNTGTLSGALIWRKLPASLRGVSMTAITITDAAHDYLADLLSKQNTPGIGIRIFITQPGTQYAETCIAYCKPGEEKPEDTALGLKSFTAYIDSFSEAFLDDAVVDYATDRMGGQLTIKAPNAKVPMVNADSPINERINYYLQTEINPGLASHGGQVSLIDVVEDGIAVLQFGGGCQGCGQADVTLKEGIERTLLERIPELKGVRDVTDHTQKENAYY
ncbi:Fe/S bioproteinsis protein NfuA [Pseudomonas syringae pv. castaneae]|nr:Fe/S bioproteinsis protein NfuA [Pseudomonas syringae pv. castaneae]